MDHNDPLYYQSHCSEGGAGPDSSHNPSSSCLLPLHELVRGQGECICRAKGEAPTNLHGIENQSKVSILSSIVS